MYNIAIKNSEVLVVDDFLEQELWDRLFNQIQCDAWTQSQVYDRYWHITDGVNYKASKRFLSDAPFNDNYDIWADAMKTFADNCKDAQDYTSGYTDITMRCHAYPVGSKNPWHHDMGGVTYSYYLHKQWHINWDGVLLVMPKNSVQYKQSMDKLPGTVYTNTYTDAGAGPGTLEMFEQEEKQKHLIEHGMGFFVAPKPNRLVLINRDVIHGISRVDTDAGQNIRLTMTGCFK